jgi:hypothetical protein
MPLGPPWGDWGAGDHLGGSGVLGRWIEKYGVPRGEVPVTRFGWMCERLGIKIIAANSPQAKGRVERNHGTHQDRLVKKLRPLCSGQEPGGGL